jgi:NAD(P)-dependent dehydrogenase (short-subunit alcohol dehydrogenase family)
VTLTLITGGGRGIGAATAVRLAAEGHDLVLSYERDADAADGTAQRVRDLGVACRVVRADVSDPDDVDALFEAAAEQGRVTGLVNNAGLTLRYADLAETPVEEVRRILDVNLLGGLLCARRAVQVMSTSGGGHGGAIVNISSGAATLGSPHEYVHYAAAKAGVDAFTVGLGKEVAAEGVRVNAVACGLVDTSLHAASGDPERVSRMASQIPVGRAADPGEIAAAVSWLLGDESSYVTGTVLRVAGGR